MMLTFVDCTVHGDSNATAQVLSKLQALHQSKSALVTWKEPSQEQNPAKEQR